MDNNSNAYMNANNMINTQNVQSTVPMQGQPYVPSYNSYYNGQDNNRNNFSAQNNLGNNYYIPNIHTPVPNYQNFWNTQNNQSIEKEYILLDGSAPNKKKKYVFVEEVEVPNTGFSLDDVRKVVSEEFDRRFGEEKK